MLSETVLSHSPVESEESHVNKLDQRGWGWRHSDGVIIEKYAHDAEVRSEEEEGETAHTEADVSSAGVPCGLDRGRADGPSGLVPLTEDVQLQHQVEDEGRPRHGVEGEVWVVCEGLLGVTQLEGSQLYQGGEEEGDQEQPVTIPSGAGLQVEVPGQVSRQSGAPDDDEVAGGLLQLQVHQLAVGLVQQVALHLQDDVDQDKAGTEDRVQLPEPSHVGVEDVEQPLLVLRHAVHVEMETLQQEVWDEDTQQQADRDDDQSEHSQRHLRHLKQPHGIHLWAELAKVDSFIAPLSTPASLPSGILLRQTH